LEKLTPEEMDVIRRKGTVIIRDVVDSKEASGWKTTLDEFIKANPHADGTVEPPLYSTSDSDLRTGFPEGDKQFFHL
jgi:hypothetical protein